MPTFTGRSVSLPNSSYTLNAWEGLGDVIKLGVKPSATGVGELLVMLNFSSIATNMEQDTLWRDWN